MMSEEYLIISIDQINVLFRKYHNETSEILEKLAKVFYSSAYEATQKNISNGELGIFHLQLFCKFFASFILNEEKMRGADKIQLIEIILATSEKYIENTISRETHDVRELMN